jgi:anthranilate synthase component 1
VTLRSAASFAPSMAGLVVRPGPDGFQELAGRWPMVPVWAELLADVATPVSVFPALSGGGPAVLLESVERSERWGRYSFVAGDPAAVVHVDAGGVRVEEQVRDLPIEPESLREVEPMEALNRLAMALRAPRLPGLPALTGGLVGFLAYEAATLLDGSGGLPVPGPASSREGSLMRFLIVDRAVVFDHWKQRLLLVVHARGDRSFDAALESLQQLASRVRALEPPPLDWLAPPPGGGSTSRMDGSPRGDGSLGVANISEERFIQAVRTAKEHILAGDIFQAVLSRRLSVPTTDDPLSVYRRLRVTNPAPYMFLVRFADVALAGSSPEPLVRVEGRNVLSRPIAGTYPRSEDPEEDRRLERDLLLDPKERAEHAMLVDLARNDLGRVCVPGSVRPTELMSVERFSRVMHLVSTVEGELREGLTPVDALGATFPAGTVTGAPKRRAMEIIAAHEPDARGPYAGAVGYLTFAGDLDFCITIRTVVMRDGMAEVQAGAGVVADSDPARELHETRTKASAILAAIDGLEDAP